MLELLKPRAQAARRFRRAGRGSSSRDAIEYDAAAVEKHLRVDGMAEHLAALDAAFAALDDVRSGLDRGGAARDWPRRAV